MDKYSKEIEDHLQAAVSLAAIREAEMASNGYYYHTCGFCGVRSTTFISHAHQCILPELSQYLSIAQSWQEVERLLLDIQQEEQHQFPDVPLQPITLAEADSLMAFQRHPAHKIDPLLKRLEGLKYRLLYMQAIWQQKRTIIGRDNAIVGMRVEPFWKISRPLQDNAKYVLINHTGVVFFHTSHIQEILEQAVIPRLLQHFRA